MKHQSHHQRHGNHSYLVFGIELFVDFVIMYLVMYTMIATFDHFYLNLNNTYMTLMMVAPMAVVMMIAMRSMFPSKKANAAILVAAVVTFAASYYGMRTQALVGDEEFLRSMIPHHSGAILMCEQAVITDPEISTLCDQIVKSQREEISSMKTILARYKR